MTENLPGKNRVWKGPLKLAVPALFWIILTLFLAISYGDTFWLWVTRAFDLSFIVYVLAVIYGLYVYLPRFGAGLGGLIMQGIQSFFVKDKMATLSEKGVLARQVKAEQNAQLEMIAAVDPLKGMAVPLIQGVIEGADSIPRALRPMLAQNAAAMLQNSQVNFTAWALQAIDQKFPQLQLQQKLKALGVITNAEKIPQ